MQGDGEGILGAAVGFVGSGEQSIFLQGHRDRLLPGRPLLGVGVVQGLLQQNRVTLHHFRRVDEIHHRRRHGLGKGLKVGWVMNDIGKKRWREEEEEGEGRTEERKKKGLTKERINKAK